MYNLPYHKDKDAGSVLAFMKTHPFIIICGADAKGAPVATQIPVLIKEEGNKIILHGHMMRNTDHHKAFIDNPQTLALFNGPHTYVSASWYSNPKQGSTWNYMSVQAHGKIAFLEEDALIKILEETTTHFEQSPSSSARFSELSPTYVQQMVKAIVAFKIEVTQLEHIFKLSQNRDQASYENIITRLEQQDDNARQIAREMQVRKDHLFKS